MALLLLLAVLATCSLFVPGGQLSALALLGHHANHGQYSIQSQNHHQNRAKHLVSRLKAPFQPRLVYNETPADFAPTWLTTPKYDIPPVVYIYTMPNQCQTLPAYLLVTFMQAVRSQPDADVIFASNFHACQKTLNSIKNIHGLKLIDTAEVLSSKTASFSNSSFELFKHGNNDNSLWRASTLRFFEMEDIMERFGYAELIHMEADNLLYQNLSSIVEVLRTSYPMAVTPLLANKSMFTASIFWVSSLNFLKEFTDFLMGISLNREDLWKKYMAFLRRWFCCKKGGPDPDSNGVGVKPFSINEMTMLAFYHQIRSDTMKLLPVLPVSASYPMRRPFCDLKQFMPGGREVGPITPPGVWDSGSWGQHLGGTWIKRGRDAGFIDSSHVIGQALMLAACEVKMLCTDGTRRSLARELNVSAAVELEPPESVKFTDSFYRTAHTAPFVRCGDEASSMTMSSWTPLWNLHVHSKHTARFLSRPCSISDP
jgi:hypothetical protein